MEKISLTGKRFGKLVVLEETQERKHGNIVYKCQCDCGNISYVARGNLIAKNGTKSCGCSRKGHSTHGKTNTRLYNIWLNMKTRCYNKNRIQYEDWGGRKIVVCDEWKNDFQTFYDWAMDNGYRDDLSIDRIDVDGNYEPDNCRWATTKQQARNKRSNVYLTYNGKTQTMIEWSEELGVDYEYFSRHRDIGLYFIKWCLSRFFSIKQIAQVFNVTLDDIMEKYHEERAKYTDEEIEKIMRRVYYENL